MPVEPRAYPRPLPNPEWLGKLTEEILEPELPIVDPHHHLWDHPGSRYLLDELLADVNSGHNIVATVFIQCGSGYRTTGPEEMRPIGESEFVRAIAEEARPARQQDENLRRHRQLRRSAAAECRCGIEGPDRGGRRPVSRHPPDRGARSGDPRRLVLCPAAGADGRPGFPPRPEAVAGARSYLRGLDLSPADQDPDRGGARVPRGEDRAEPFRRSARGRPVQARRSFPRLAAPTSGNWPPARMCM